MTNNKDTVCDFCIAGCVFLFVVKDNKETDIRYGFVH